jgi:O-antigen biosynthesis protein
MSETAQRLQPWEGDHVLKLPELFRFNPLQYPICTRTPHRHNVLSAWIGHVPFAMCLVDMLKPRLLVELGAYWGVSYCAFCQAVKERRLPTKCFAVDTWQGDPQARFYTSEVYEDLKSHHDERYSLFSNLLRSTFNDAVDTFADKTIDVLHIDGYHTYDAVKQDYETWLPKMSDYGVVLFHDIEIRDREEFGVWRFWDEIKQKYPHFAFYHCYGLGVLAVGENTPENLRPLLDMSESEGDRIRQFFANLGDHLTVLYNTALQKENVAELLHAKTDECTRLSGALEEKVAGLEQTLTWHNCRVAELEAALQTERQRTANLQEMIAARDAYHSQFRFRATDRAARLLGRVPVVYRPLRVMARGLARVLRMVKRLVLPPRA